MPDRTDIELFAAASGIALFNAALLLAALAYAATRLAQGFNG